MDLAVFTYVMSLQMEINKQPFQSKQKEMLLKKFNDCFDSYKDSVCACVCAIVGRKAESEEITQDVFLSFLKYLMKGTEVKSPADFVFRIARNKALDFIRKERRRDKIVRETVKGIYEAKSSQDSLDKEVLTKLNQAIEALPAEQHEVLIMKLYGNLTFVEIGSICGVSKKTANSRYHYALEKIAKFLGPNYE